MLAVADEMTVRSLSFAGALNELATLLSKIAVAQTAPQALSEDAPERDDVLRLARVFSPEEAQLHYQIVIHGRNELPYAPDEATGFTMTLLRMLAFRPATAGDSEGSGQGATARAAAPSAVPRAASGAGSRVPMSREARTPTVSETGLANSVTASTPESTTRASVSVTDSQARTEPAAAASAGTFDGNWSALIARLPLTGFVRAWAVKSEMASFDRDVFALRVATDKLAADNPMQEKLRAAIEQYLGRPVRLAVSVGGLNGESIAAIEEKKNDARQQAAEKAIMSDPFVRELIAQTGARATNIESNLPSK